MERSFAWATRFRRLAKDYERLPEVVEGLYFLAFLSLMLKRLFVFATQSVARWDLAPSPGVIRNVSTDLVRQPERCEVTTIFRCHLERSREIWAFPCTQQRCLALPSWL